MGPVQRCAPWRGDRWPATIRPMAHGSAAAPIDLPAPPGTVATAPMKRRRAAVTPVKFLASSSLERPPPARSDDTALIADQLGITPRGLDTAREMLLQHLAVAGNGQAGRLIARFSGTRAVELEAAGLVVAGSEPTKSVGVALIADPLVILAVGSVEQALHWRLLPGGPSITARANGLRLLRAMSSGGELRFRLGKRDELPPLVVDGGTWTDEEEWRLFEDLATVEEWSGACLPVPSEVSAEDATRAAQAAGWIRTQEVPATLTGPIEFSAIDTSALEADELRIHQDFALSLFDVDVPLGEGTARIALERLELAPNGDRNRIRAWPSKADITFTLNSPPTRRGEASRTQPRRVAAPKATDASLKGLSAVARPASSRLRDVLSARSERRNLSTVASTRALLDNLRT